MSCQVHPDVMARLPPGIPDRFYIKLDPAHFQALLLELDSSNLQAGDSCYIPAGTVMVPPLDLPPFPSTADEID